MALQAYTSKRNFKRTSEPSGKKASRRPGREPLFVIQKHDATRLHYDFRLEMDGVLKSWAVPKGIPTKKGKPRLAVAVEDHPLEYAGFEGVIPEGNYGAGSVMVWDTGTYQVSGDPIEALSHGKLHFTLKGSKLQGEWSLVRMRRTGDKDHRNWLLLKSGSNVPAISRRDEDRSVLTQRSQKQIAVSNDRQWQSSQRAKRTVKQTQPGRKENSSSKKGQHELPATVRTRFTASPTVSSNNGSAVERVLTVHTQEHARRNQSVARSHANLLKLPRAKPAFVEPMKALPVHTLPRGASWVYEIKFDGVRALAIKQKNKVALVSRMAKDLGGKYPEILDALRNLECQEAVLDGEVVALDSQGRSSFQSLQSYDMAPANRPPLFYYVFDVINFNGRNVSGLPLMQRKELAESLLVSAPQSIRFSGPIRADSARVMQAMKKRGLEGLIGKRVDSKYEPGRRSGAWTKFKWTNEQEFVIGGYTRPKGGRRYFGAMLVGYYENGEFKYAAKVGTGFSEKVLASLFREFQGLVRSDCPFVNLPQSGDSASVGLTLAQRRQCTWLNPKLVCQVRFAEWTRDGHLRQPAFLGLRNDKAPKEVTKAP